MKNHSKLSSNAIHLYNELIESDQSYSCEYFFVLIKINSELSFYRTSLDNFFLSSIRRNDTSIQEYLNSLIKVEWSVAIEMLKNLDLFRGRYNDNEEDEISPYLTMYIDFDSFIFIEAVNEYTIVDLGVNPNWQGLTIGGGDIIGFLNIDLDTLQPTGNNKYKIEY
jgi:hypothetical protein